MNGFKRKVFRTFKKFSLKLLYMSDEDDVVKPIKHTSSQKILEKLELIGKRLKN